MPINNYQIVTTSNSPVGSDFMDSTAPTYLVTELQDLKATERSVDLSSPWTTLEGLTSGSWTGALNWTYLSGTQAIIQGNQTATGTGYLQVGQRVRAFVNAGTIYGYITAATFAATQTTVTFVWDSGAALDSGVTDIQTAGDVQAVGSIPRTLVRLYRHTNQTLATTTPTNDDTLTFNINRNEVWRFSADIYSSTGGFNVSNVTGPGGSTIRAGLGGPTGVPTPSSLSIERLEAIIQNGAIAGAVHIVYTASSPPATILTLTNMVATRVF